MVRRLDTIGNTPYVCMCIDNIPLNNFQDMWWWICAAQQMIVTATLDFLTLLPVLFQMKGGNQFVGMFFHSTPVQR